MGLDIARRIVVTELGGELSLRTKPGLGTTFTLRVPVTVAVVDTFRFESAKQAFLVPVASVEEFVEVEPADVVLGPFAETRTDPVALFTNRGRTMPFVDLASLIGSPAAKRGRKAIIVKRNEQLFAFGVDRLVDHHEVIVRRLVDPLVDVRGVTGAADLGDGRPTLLLDLIALTRFSNEAERAA
jgi:two-component system chemotaxis sensor kinase CheA